jgi:glucose/arabinose dehydrogenase
MHVSGRMRVPLVLLLVACQGSSHADPRRDPRCVQVDYGYGRESAVPIAAEVVASGLEVPWGLQFLPDGSMLVSERRGALVRIERGHKREVAHVSVARRTESGLLGIALHPDFARNRWLYLYYTVDGRRGAKNRVERWRMAPDFQSAVAERVIIDGIPSAPYHDGGRIAFGPDRKLYVATGDATKPALAQDPNSLAGKILRLEDDGAIPSDNPRAGNPLYMLGVRNVESLAWRADGALAVADHGPSGELGRSGHDEITFATAGANLGWPAIYGCDTRPGMLAPSLTWSDAVPPGGAVFYDGGSITEWRGDLVVATLQSHHLQHVRFDHDGNAIAHDVALTDHGRVRTAVIGPDRELYVTTSNCDGRGDCPRERDVILRVTRAR